MAAQKSRTDDGHATRTYRHSRSRWRVGIAGRGRWPGWRRNSTSSLPLLTTVAAEGVFATGQTWRWRQGFCGMTECRFGKIHSWQSGRAHGSRLWWTASRFGRRARGRCSGWRLNLIRSEIVSPDALLRLWRLGRVPRRNTNSECTRWQPDQPRRRKRPPLRLRLQERAGNPPNQQCRQISPRQRQPVP